MSIVSYARIPPSLPLNLVMGTSPLIRVALSVGLAFTAGNCEAKLQNYNNSYVLHNQLMYIGLVDINYTEQVIYTTVDTSLN